MIGQVVQVCFIWFYLFGMHRYQHWISTRNSLSQWEVVSKNLLARFLVVHLECALEWSVSPMFRCHIISGIDVSRQMLEWTMDQRLAASHDKRVVMRVHEHRQIQHRSSRMTRAFCYCVWFFTFFTPLRRCYPRYCCKIAWSCCNNMESWIP